MYTTSRQWIVYFRQNATRQRINWDTAPQISTQETAAVLASLQAWQLGETSDGANLLRAATLYAHAVNDVDYIEAVSLFIKEEQKHGNNLGRYLDLIGQPRIRHNWGDALFRKVRYFNTSMEIWTVTVIVVESAAQLFYQSLKDATGCPLLQQICTDILIDEAPHIRFQHERLAILFNRKSAAGKAIRTIVYRSFFCATACVIWLAHRRLFTAGGHGFARYWRKMQYKYRKTFGRLQERRLFGNTRTAGISAEQSSLK